LWEGDLKEGKKHPLKKVNIEGTGCRTSDEFSLALSGGNFSRKKKSNSIS